MKKVLGVYRQILQTLNPSSYGDFSQSKLKNTFNYYTTMTFNAFVIMILLLIPTFIQMPTTIESYFNNVDTLTFNGEFKTNAPLEFPKGNPTLLVSYANETPTQEAKAILYNNKLYYSLFFNQYEFDFNKIKDAKANTPDFANLISFMILLMVPTLLLIMYAYIILKFFMIVIGAAIIARIISEIVRYRVDFKKLFNCAMYGITATVFIDLVFFAIGFKFYYIQYLPLVIYVIFSITNNGEKVVSEKNRKYVEVK